MTKRILYIFPGFHFVHLNKDVGQIPYWLMRRGYSVEILTTDTNLKDNIFNNIKIIKIKNYKISINPNPNLRIYFGILHYILRNYKNYDVFIMYFPQSITTILTTILLKFLDINKKIIIKMDSDGKLYTRGKKPIRFIKKIIGNIIFSTLYKLTNVFLIIETPQARKEVIKRHVWLTEKLICIPNGINCEIINIKFKKNLKPYKIILFVGDIIPRKGIDILIASIKNLKNYNIKLILVGDFSKNKKYFYKLKKLIKKYNLNNIVEFTGRVNNRKLQYLYNIADIYCSASRYESYGLTIQEAQYFGCAVIASNVGAAEYLLENGKLGILFKPEDAEQIEHHLKYLLENINIVKKLGKISKTRVLTQLCWDKVIEKYIKLIEKK